MSEFLSGDKKMMLDGITDQSEVPTMIDQEDPVVVREGEEDRIEHAVDHIADCPAEISEKNFPEEEISEAIILINSFFCDK